MTTYQLRPDQSSVLRTEDGATIPFDEGNADYREYLLWLGEGNTPEPAPAPPPHAQPTAEERLEAAGLTVEDLRSLLGL